MDAFKINAIKQRIEVISQGSARVKLELYSGLLDSTIGVSGLHDNIMHFLDVEMERRATGNSSARASEGFANISAPSAVSASSTPYGESRFSQAPGSVVSSVAPSSAAYASMPMGGSSAYSAAPGFAPQLIPSTPGMGGYSLGAGRQGFIPLRAPLNLSGIKKGRRNTRRRR